MFFIISALSLALLVSSCDQPSSEEKETEKQAHKESHESDEGEHGGKHGADHESEEAAEVAQEALKKNQEITEAAGEHKGHSVTEKTSSSRGLTGFKRK